MVDTSECNIGADTAATAERHERELFAFKQLTPPEQARVQLAARVRYTAEPWEFLRDCVFTLDQVSATPIKAFPSYLTYLEFLCELWRRERLIAIPKSRRMVCSWNFIALYLHNAIFTPGRFHGYVSKKEDDAGELIARAEFIYKHIPEWRIPPALLPAIKNGKMSKQPPLLEFEEINSRIQGFPQGADQMRQFTLSGIFGDECAFWDDAQAFYSASKPTLDGGGRMTLVSSRAPGFFKKIVFDQLDAQDLHFPEQPPQSSQQPMEGIELWRNPANKFVVVDLHYTANPAKRGTLWREEVRRSMPIRDFLMEYERSWDTYEGKPVYGDFNRKLHVTDSAIEPEPGLPLLFGIDFGLTPAAVLCQLVGRQLRVLAEFIETDGPIAKLAERIWKHLQVNYAPWLSDGVSGGDDKIYMWCDPAGFQRAQTDARTCADVLRTQGFRRIQPGPVDWESRRKAVEAYLTKTYGEGPALLIARPACPVLLAGFGGGYQYPEKALEVEPANVRPLKNRFSHPHDALQYLCAGTTQLRRNYGIELPTPNYGRLSGAS